MTGVEAFSDTIKDVFSSGCIGSSLTLLVIGYVLYVALKEGLLGDLGRILDR